MKVMVLEPGPNSGTIGCGGSILKHIKNGNEVYMVSLTYGDASTADFPPDVFRARREIETRKAARVLRIPQSHLYFLGHDVFAISIEKATQEIMRLLREIKPNICYMPSPEGTHPDYKATYEAATTALAFSGGKWFKSAENHQDSWTVPTVLIYEVSVPLGLPSYYEVVSGFMGKKKKALMAHSSQTASRRYDESSRHLNRFRGIMSRKGRFCEAFEVLRVEMLF